MNLLDWALVVALGLAAFNGWRRGAALQLTAYAGLLLGLVLGALLAPVVAGLAHAPLSRAGLALATLVALAAIGDAVGWMIGTRIWRVAHRGPFGLADSALGTVVALAAVLLTVWFVGLSLSNGPIPELSSEIRGSAIVKGLDRTLPRPPSLLAEVETFLNRFGFPQVFADLPPAPAGPVSLPKSGETRTLARAAEPSTVKIVGQGCGAILEGSGFVVGAHYVVTNAHVVAGVRGPKVQEQNGVDETAVPVLFDPKLDIAILYVRTPPGPALVLVDGAQDRAEQGVVLGYPGGGGFDAQPAAIRRELDAIGRDIYGGSIVERKVYELQAKVRPGNSGGPFVVTDGKVAGVVFAASTTDGDVGYAIASTEVIPKVRAATGRTAAVSTEGCAAG
jgi:S1-C subfamily serine protease